MPQSPPVWQRIKEAAAAGCRTNKAINDWIQAKYPGTNPTTVYTQINFCTVNSPSRIHGPENQRVRTEPHYLDILYKVERATYEAYDPAKHGLWQILKDDSGKYYVHREGDAASTSEDVTPPGESAEPSADSSSAFSAEYHLRDYLAANLSVIEPGLMPYGDEQGSVFVEYRTPIGTIEHPCDRRNGRHRSHRAESRRGTYINFITSLIHASEERALYYLNRFIGPRGTARLIVARGRALGLLKEQATSQMDFRYHWLVGTAHAKAPQATHEPKRKAKR